MYLGNGFYHSYDNHPMLAYFKSEYKNEWEYQFMSYMEEKKASTWFKKKLKSLLHILKMAFPSEEYLFEQRLSKCSNLSEVEHLIRERDRNRYQQNFLEKRNSNYGLVA